MTCESEQEAVCRGPGSGVAQSLGCTPRVMTPCELDPESDDGDAEAALPEHIS